MSGTAHFFRGLTRAGQRPFLTVALFFSVALPLLIASLPLYFLLRSQFAGRPFADELLRGNLMPFMDALAEGRSAVLLGPLLAAALVFALLRLFFAGGIFTRLHPAGGYGISDSFLGHCARHFFTFLIHLVFNLIFLAGLLLIATLASAPLFKAAKHMETPGKAQLLTLLAAALFWLARSFAARALDLGRAHIVNRGGGRPLEGFLTGVRLILRQPIAVLSLSLWGAALNALLFACWFLLDYPVHIDGFFSWLLALVLLALYLLAACFIRVALAGGAVAMITKG